MSEEFNPAMRELDEMNEFVELMKEMDVTKFGLMDQMACALAFNEFIQKVKPIYLKYAAKDTEVSNFLFKL